jgi:hypothetical protein
MRVWPDLPIVNGGLLYGRFLKCRTRCGMGEEGKTFGLREGMSRV